MPNMQSPRLPALSEETLTTEQRALAESIRSGPRGQFKLAGPFAVYLHSPEFGELAQTRRHRFDGHEGRRDEGQREDGDETDRVDRFGRFDEQPEKGLRNTGVKDSDFSFHHRDAKAAKNSL